MMQRWLHFFQSTVGLKIIMGLSGLGLVGFVIIHMLGNLQIFLGPEALNHYGYTLKSNAAILWTARLGLLAMVFTHIAAGVALVRKAREARPESYAKPRALGATIASRTMILSGLVILSFVIFHILHFTAHVTHPEYAGWHDSAGRHDVYKMVVAGFMKPWISGFYILSVGLLCLHLTHGVSSIFKSLGFTGRNYAGVIHAAGQIIAWMVFLGMSIVPIAVLAGWIKG